MSDVTNRETVEVANQILAELQQAARDGQLIQNGYYATEAAGRAAVADGETFKVVGSEDVAAHLYRRIDAATSVALTQISSFAGTQSPGRILGETYGADLAKFAPRFAGTYTNISDGKTYMHSNQSIASMYVPVVAGRRYRIKASMLVQNYIAPSIATTAVPVSGAQLVPLVLDFAAAGMEAGEAVLTIPEGGRYLALNLALLSGGFDIKSSISVFEMDRADAKADAVRNGVVARSQMSEAQTNWGTKGARITGRFVNADTSVPETVGQLASANGAVMLRVPVRPGARYRIQASSFASAYFAITCQPHGNYQVNETMGRIAAIDDGLGGRVFDVPATGGARYAYLNVYLPSVGWDISSGLSILEETEVAEVDGTRISDVRTRNALNVGSITRIRGKRWCAIGDSITEKNFRATLNYHDYIKAALGELIVDNKGISGSGYYNRHAVAETITTTPDVITVFLGTNDWGGVGVASTMQLGALGDAGTATVAGCIDMLLTGLLTKFPTTPIGIAAPLPRAGCWGLPGTANNRGYTLRQLVDLIRQYAQHYSLPLIDLYTESNLPVWTDAGNAAFFTAPGRPDPDGLHPNDAGQAVIARKFVRLLEKL